MARKPREAGSHKGQGEKSNEVRTAMGGETVFEMLIKLVKNQYVLVW